MVIAGLLAIRLRIGYSKSLKDKRRVLKSLICKTKNKFNVSISEVDDLESWHYAGIGVAFVTNDTIYAQQVLNKLIEYLEGSPEYEIISISREIMQGGIT